MTTPHHIAVPGPAYAGAGASTSGSATASSATTYATADLIDIAPDTPSCELQMRSFGLRRRFHGRVRTLRCHHDNALLRRLFSEPGNGDVLVVDGGGSLACALIGDVLVALAAANGWAGAVVNGAVRDSALLDRFDFGIKALGTNPRKSSKAGAGEIDVTVAFGAVSFAPGQFVYSDDDGIVVAATRIPI